MKLVELTYIFVYLCNSQHSIPDGCSAVVLLIYTIHVHVRAV